MPQCRGAARARPLAVCRPPRPAHPGCPPEVAATLPLPRLQKRRAVSVQARATSCGACVWRTLKRWRLETWKQPKPWRTLSARREECCRKPAHRPQVQCPALRSLEDGFRRVWPRSMAHRLRRPSHQPPMGQQVVSAWQLAPGVGPSAVRVRLLRGPSKCRLVPQTPRKGPGLRPRRAREGGGSSPRSLPAVGALRPRPSRRSPMQQRRSQTTKHRRVRCVWASCIAIPRARGTVA